MSNGNSSGNSSDTSDDSDTPTNGSGSNGHWIQQATDKMAKKGTLGSFGTATPKKVAAAKAAGGAQEKKAVFANNMKQIANKGNKPPLRKRTGEKS